MKTLLLLLALMALRISGAAAQPCRCQVDERLSEKQRIFHAFRTPLIFTGRILRAEILRAGDTVRARSRFSGADTVYIRHYGTVRYTFAVTRRFKGPAATGPTVQVSARPPASNKDWDDCGIRFRPDEDYLIYAHRLDQEYPFGEDARSFPLPPYFEANPCNRTKVLRAAEPAELQQLAELARRLGTAKPASGVATPAGRRR